MPQRKLEEILWRQKRTSIGCDAGGDPYAEETKVIVLGTKRANDFKPQGDHNVFTHFPEDPNCEVCRMTNTTRARCKNRPLTRVDGIPHLTTCGELVTADHKILNLDDESRNDYRNTLFVQDGHSKLATDAPETPSCLRDSYLRRSQAGSSQTTQRSSSKRVRTYNGRMTRILLFVQRRDRGKSCSTSRRRNDSDGSKWH